MLTVQLRRGTALEWSTTNPVLAEGEMGLELDTNQLKYGDGSAPWSDLAYAGGMRELTVTFTSDSEGLESIDFLENPPYGKFYKIHGIFSKIVGGSIPNTTADADLNINGDDIEFVLLSLEDLNSGNGVSVSNCNLLTESEKIIITTRGLSGSYMGTPLNGNSRITLKVQYEIVPLL